MFPKTPAICYFELYNYYGSECYNGLQVLFKSIISEEIDTMPRRTISLGREKLFSQDEQLQAQKDLFDLIQKHLVQENKTVLEKLSSSQELDGLIRILLSIITIIMNYDRFNFKL